MYNIYELIKQVVTIQNITIMYIKTGNMCRPQINYIPFGTMGYVKTIHNEVRQCKCLGGRTMPMKEGADQHSIQYEWKVAGYKEHFFTFSSCCLPIGHIYKDEVSAQRGSADTEYGSQKGEMAFDCTFPIFNYLINKYDMDVKCFNMMGTFGNLLEIKTYAKLKDNTTRLRSTDFEVIVDENGIDCRIPMLDGEVDGIRRYPTAEKAYDAMKPLKTYLLDDDDEDDVMPTPTKIKVTIEVEIDNIDNVKKYATILE